MADGRGRDLEGLQRSFDRIAEDYAAQFFHELDGKPFDVARLHRFATQWTSGLVLDVGCGPGHIGRFLSAAGLPVFGLDLAHGALRVARRLTPGLPFVAGDMRALPLADGALGGLVGFYAVIYFDGEETAAILQEFHRVLRVGAPVVLAVHGGVGSERFTDYRGTPVDVTLHYHDAHRLTALTEAAGFEIEAVESRPPYPFEHPTPRIYLTARRR